MPKFGCRSPKHALRSPTEATETNMPDFYVQDHGTQVPIQQYGLVFEIKRLKNFFDFYCPPRQHHPRKGFSRFCSTHRLHFILCQKQFLQSGSPG